MKLPKRDVLGVPRAVTVIACVLPCMYACVCACAQESLVKGVPNSEHSINTPLISQQYILNSDELIFLVLERRRRWRWVGGWAGKDEVHWVQNSNKERTG